MGIYVKVSLSEIFYVPLLILSGIFILYIHYFKFISKLVPSINQDAALLKTL